MVGFRAIAALGVHPGVNRACILTVGSKPSISALVGLFFSPPELCDIIPVPTKPSPALVCHAFKRRLDTSGFKHPAMVDLPQTAVA